MYRPACYMARPSLLLRHKDCRIMEQTSFVSPEILQSHALNPKSPNSKAPEEFP